MPNGFDDPEKGEFPVRTEWTTTASRMNAYWEIGLLTVLRTRYRPSIKFTFERVSMERGFDDREESKDDAWPTVRC